MKIVIHHSIVGLANESVLIEDQKEGYIALLINETKECKEGIPDGIEEVLQKNDIRCATAISTNGVDGLARAFLQTKMAIVFQDTAGVIAFDDVSVEALLKTISQDGDISLFCDRRALVLRDYDKEHNSELARCLVSYFSNGKSATKASDEMFIHRNTLLYRLDKIRQLVGDDAVDSSDSFASMYISCKIMLAKLV